MNYKLFQQLTEAQKAKYVVTSKSTDNYPHLYKSSDSDSRHFSFKFESKMSPAQIKDICRYAIFLTQGKCAYCGDTLINLKNGEKYGSKDLNWDHIKPASKYNILTYGNVLLSCSDCNIKKSDNDILTWFKERLNNDEFPNALFTYEEFETLLEQELEQYSKDYPWVKIVNSDYFHNNENMDEKDLTLMTILHKKGAHGLVKNSVNTYNCSKNYLDEVQILLEALPEDDRAKKSYERFDQAFRNNFGKIECYLTNEIESLLVYEDFLYAFELFGSILQKETYLKINQLLNKIVKYHFKKDYTFPSYKERIIYLKDID